MLELFILNQSEGKTILNEITAPERPFFGDLSRFEPVLNSSKAGERPY
jgi:hypothetical protein